MVQWVCYTHFLTARINRLNEYTNQGKTDTYAVVIAETTLFSTIVAFIDGVHLSR